MTPQQLSAFVGPHPQLPEDAAQHARCMERIARTKAAGMWRHLPTNNRESFNRETGRFEYAPIDRDAWNEWFADIQANRAANEPKRRVEIAGTIPCQECEGLGFIQYDAGFTETMAVCDCSHCGGTGWRK